MKNPTFNLFLDERRCSYKDAAAIIPGSEDFLPVYPLLYECDPTTGEPSLRTTYPREETNPSSVMFWAAAFILLDVFWAVSALFLDGRIAGR